MTMVVSPLPATAPALVPSAVVWINGRMAMVASVSRDGLAWTCEVDRGMLQESAYLAKVVHVIGDCRRVAILGPSSTRLSLEREYVTIFHRPDRLIDVEPADAVEMDELVRRAKALAA
jgi:hypothetical protein